MPTHTRPRPTPDIELVFHPQRDGTCRHFPDADAHPFDPTPGSLGRRNAWWLAEASLLTYWPPDHVVMTYAGVGFEAEPVFGGTTQSYLAWNDRVVLVSFRGTEPGEPGDVLDDVAFVLGPWDNPDALAHVGFTVALDRVWPTLANRLQTLATARTVWFGGHSLGAALAVLAADRYHSTAGVCSFGAPRVGDIHFAEAHTRRFGAQSLRYVNDADIITHVPPPFPYRHGGHRRFIDANGHISANRPAHHHFFRELIGRTGHIRDMRLALDKGHMHEPPDFLLDHMPRGYVVDAWNDYAMNGD